MDLFDEVCDAVGEPWADDAFFIFSILASGRAAAPLMTRKLEALLEHRTRWPTPRELERPGRMVRRWVKMGVVDMKLRELRTGRYRQIGGALRYWADTGLDVADPGLLSPAPLEAVPGVGQWMARLFLLRRRPGRCRVAVLDRPVLRFLADCGVTVLPSDPGRGERRYTELEGEVLRRADAAGMEPGRFGDLVRMGHGLVCGWEKDEYDGMMLKLYEVGLATF